MLVQVHTDNHVHGSEELSRRVESEVTATLGRFDGQITRVEVHLNDVNSHKQGNDKRCLMEARLAGHQPLAVSHTADTLDEAYSGAAEKLERALSHVLDRLGERKGRTSMGGEQTI
jgi:hypothetical protein